MAADGLAPDDARPSTGTVLTEKLDIICCPSSFADYHSDLSINTLRPRQNGRHFADDIFKCIFLNENAGISLKISLKFVPKIWINNIQALVQIMAWRRPGDKPLSEPMMDNLLTHIWVTRPQWVKLAVGIEDCQHLTAFCRPSDENSKSFWWYSFVVYFFNDYLYSLKWILCPMSSFNC